MKIINTELFNETFQYFDKEIVVEIIDIFINEYSERISKINEAIQTKNFADLKFTAHSMKGVVANFAVPELQAMARDLEIAGAEQNLNNIDEKFANFSTQSQWLVDDLTEIRSQFL
ncbi:MAG: Hpt domain-containing protein [Bacteroidales bacterium]|nr:Hpt domain-containing protein [Bacteroidales bacterium]